MTTFVFVACSKKKDKTESPLPAQYRYEGDLFKKSLGYARTLTRDETIFILSAKYFVIHLDDLIDDYDETLNDFKKDDRIAWSRLVMDVIDWNITKHPEPYEFVLLCGEKYCEFIERELAMFGEVKRPLKGLGIGQQLAYLKEELR